MKSLILSAFAVSMALGSFAADAETSRGQIASVSTDRQTVTLQGGETITFPAAKNFHPLEGYLPGDEVTIEWNQRDGHAVGQAISSAVARDVSGVVARIDRMAGTVTLSDGTTYSLGHGKQARAALAGFRAGDAVRVIGVTGAADGAPIRARSIGGAAFDQMTGTVQQADAMRGQLVLADGTSFEVHESSVKNVLSALRPGDRVKVSWTESGTTRIARALNPADS